jgi:hypothetical protein
LGNRKEARPAEAFFRATTKPFLFAFVGPLKSIRPVWDWQVARKMAIAAKEKSGQGFRLLSNEAICEEKI